jgi:glutamate N-acetyltransferase/amino-acid N-acetyltransferase
MATAAEQAAGLPPRTALVLSTGVIGVPLPVAQVSHGLQEAAARLTPSGGVEAARAIMTTDTRAKHCAARIETPAGPITVGGIAKGAGMIHPDMATLLGVLTTDAKVDAAALTPILRRVADRSFNAISVDGDTSTNDTVLILANGVSGIDPTRDPGLLQRFEDAVLLVARTLALAIVVDGEGATKLVEIQVRGAMNEGAARDVGRAIARSALVKTAIFGADPNWGRILAAAGAAGVPFAPDKLGLHAEDDAGWLELARGGGTANPDLARARTIFQGQSIRLRIDLGMGRAEAVVWTCDLSPEYVRINADYTS